MSKGFTKTAPGNSAFEQAGKTILGIQAGKCPQVMLVFGSDDFLTDYFSTRILKALKLALPNAETQAVEDPTELYDALFSGGLFASQRIVHLKNGDAFFGKDANKQNTELLSGFLQNPDADTTLLISATTVSKRGACYKKASAFDMLEIPSQDLSRYQHKNNFYTDLTKHVLPELGKKMSKDAFELLLLKTGPDTRRVFGELTKLASFCGTREQITQRDIEQVVGESAEKKFYNFTQSLADKKTEETLEIYAKLRFQNESSLGLLRSARNYFKNLVVAKGLFAHLDRRMVGNVNGFYSRLDEVKDAVREHAGVETLEFLNQHPFRVYNFFVQSTRFSAKELERDFIILLEGETAVKTNFFAEDAFVGKLIIQITKNLPDGLLWRKVTNAG